MSQTPSDHPQHGFTNAFVKAFLDSNLSLILILLAVVVGIAALVITPREEDPQIVVPLADVYVSFPGHSAQEVEQLVTTPLERILYQIDGVEYVYSMSQPDRAIITVRYYVGEDRERSLVKLFKKLDENHDIVPPGVAGWVVKPVEIDDVPIVTLTLTADKPGLDSHDLRRVSEELVQRLSAVKELSRAYVIGGEPRVMQVYLDPDRMASREVSPPTIAQAIQGANVTETAGSFSRNDREIAVEVGRAFAGPEDLRNLVVAVWNDGPVYLKDVAEVRDGPAEVASYVRHAWGPSAGQYPEPEAAGTILGTSPGAKATATADTKLASVPAVTIAIAKKKGSNAVWVANAVLKEAEKLKHEVVPDGMSLVVTRNYGLTADNKVNELVEALAVAIVIVIALLTLGLGWREALIVAVAVPVVFGLTLAVNLMAGFSINRVTLFALILSLGLLVDDPIVDVENISRHFALRKKATRKIVLEAVAEIRPPLISATLAVILSFIPMFFITGMMGPYMRPMALNVPIAMLMSMLVAFTITPWLAYHVLKKHYHKSGPDQDLPPLPLERPAGASAEAPRPEPDPHDLAAVRQSLLWRMFYPLMAPLLHHRWMAWTFLGVMGLLTLGATMLAATRHVPLKMLPFDNKNELLLVIDFDRGTTLERSDAAVREMEDYLRTVPEVTDVTSYVGVASPIDFNGLVRHYYLRQYPHQAEIRVNLVSKKHRDFQSHALGLRERDKLTEIASQHEARVKVVETPPGPPVIASLVGEIYGQPHHSYDDLISASRIVRQRMAKEPAVVEVDDTVEAAQTKLRFVVDKDKAALTGVNTADIAATVETSLNGQVAGTVHVVEERNPLLIELRLPRWQRSSTADLSQVQVRGATGRMVPLAELGKWEESRVDQTIYHKNLQRVVYVFGETAGRAPAEAIVDIQADHQLRIGDPKPGDHTLGAQPVALVSDSATPRPLAGRTFFSNGGGIPWALPEGIRVDFAGEGEWKITLDVFRDLGLAFAAAMVAIYILLVWQTSSFVIPLIVMMAIPLTVLGVMPGFYLLNAALGGHVGSYANPVFFTATGMIGMIALSGIVTRDSIILVDFIHLSLSRGRSLFDAIMESRVVRLRPILLTAGAAMLSAMPIVIDPIFSGLAWSLIFGLLASTVFTLFVIPVAYWLLYANKPGHGLPMTTEK